MTGGETGEEQQDTKRAKAVSAMPVAPPGPRLPVVVRPFGEDLFAAWLHVISPSKA